MYSNKLSGAFFGRSSALYPGIRSPMLSDMDRDS